MRGTLIATIFASLTVLVSAAPLPDTANPSGVSTVGTTSSSPATLSVVAVTEPHHIQKEEKSHFAKITEEQREEKTAVGLQRRMEQAHQEYYTDKQHKKHEEAAQLVQNARQNDRTADLHLNAHKESTQNAHAALAASIDAHAAGDHKEGNQKMKEHDSHMKNAQDSATKAGKEAKKAGENRAKASAIIEKNNLEKGHRDFRGL